MADTSTNDWKLLYEAGRQALQLRKLQEAEQSFSAALQIAEDYPSGDPRLAATLNALARSYSLQHRYLAAAALLNRLLEVTERTLGPSHVQVAGVLTNLAEMYTHLGAAREELELRERVLAIRASDANADAASLQRLRDRIAELSALLAAQEPPAEDEDERDEGPEPMAGRELVESPSEQATERPVPLPVAVIEPPLATIEPPERESHVVASDEPVLSMVGASEHAAADVGASVGHPAARRARGWSNLYSIAAGVLLLGAVLSARRYVTAPGDERSSPGAVNVANGAASATMMPVAQGEPASEMGTVEHLIARRHLERSRADGEMTDYEVAREADRIASSASDGATPRAPRAPAGLERALHGVDGAVRAVDERARAAADSAMAIRMQAPSFAKVRLADP